MGEDLDGEAKKQNTEVIWMLHVIKKHISSLNSIDTNIDDIFITNNA